MQLVPLQHMSQGSSRKPTLHDTRGDVHDYLILPVLRMKVCRSMIIPIHGDDNTEESTDNRHIILHAPLSSPNDQAQPRASRVAGWPSAGALGYVPIPAHSDILCLDIETAASEKRAG